MRLGFATGWQNGQPTTGVENLSTTEDGSYTLMAGRSSLLRKANAKYVIPSENEWYKSAYYDPNKGGSGVAGYWLYDTRSDSTPSNLLSSAGTNNANFTQWRYLYAR